MLIDWFTVAAQIINFLILIALLRRFLYGPVLRAIDNRQRTIDESRAMAANAEREATAQAAALAGERETLARGREEFLRQAADEVESWREAALAGIKGEVAERQQLWRRQLADEQAVFFERLKAEIGAQIVRVAGKVLADLADERIEARLIEHFLARLTIDDPPGEGRERPQSGALQVVTGLPLGLDQREKIRRRLSALFGSDQPLTYTEEPGLGFGIKLTAGDQAWEWNLARYLEGLELDIRQVLATARTAGATDA